MPSQSYLERYLAGEREAVWNELIASGDAIRRMPLLDEAVAVSQEIVRRAKYNLGLLHQRLLDLGYQFANPGAAFRLAEAEDVRQIDEVERQLGILPLFVRVWYESIASVDFSQNDAQLIGPTDSEVGGLGAHPDLMLRSLRACQETQVEMAAEDAKHRAYLERLKAEKPELYSEMYQVEPDDPLENNHFLLTGGAASNCEPKGFQLPCLGVDGVLFNDGFGDAHLVPYLRNCFRWGGFPLCAYWAAGNKPFAWLARPNWERVIPLLSEGLIEI